MYNKTLICTAMLAAATLSAPASAKQPTVGTLGAVQGNVSIGGKGFVSKARSGAPLADGNSVLVSTHGKAVVHLNNGCAITLAGGQHFTVDSTQSCEVLQASVKQLLTPYQVAQAGGAPIGGGLGGAVGGGGVAGLGTGLGISGAITAIGAIDVNRTEDKNSPN